MKVFVESTSGFRRALIAIEIAARTELIHQQGLPLAHRPPGRAQRESRSFVLALEAVV